MKLVTGLKDTAINIEVVQQAIPEKKTLRLNHIDGIKGILCFMVMFGHFWNIYRNCQERSQFSSSLLNLVQDSFLDSPFLVATFWLYAFLVISGFLLSVSKIRSVEELVKKTIKRFLRFAIPVFGACCIIFLLQETVGFHVTDTMKFFSNKWFQKYYNVKLPWTAVFTETLATMISAKCGFNAPFWVIRDMFLSSVAMYTCSFANHRIGKKSGVLPILCLIIAMWADRPVIIACFAGYLLGFWKEPIRKLTDGMIGYVMFFAAIFTVTYLLRHYAILPDVFDKIFVYILVWCAVIIYVNRSPKLQAFFSARFFLKMGKIGFGVFAFHWPVTCSIGSLVLTYGLENQWQVAVSFGLALIVSILITVVISAVYNKTVEAGTDKIIRMF